MAPDFNKRDKEIELAEASADHMPIGEYAMWQKARVPHRVSVHLDCILVLWQMRGGSPHVIDSVTFTDISLSWQTGLALLVKNQAGAVQWITHEPKRLLGNPVFVWTPFFHDMRYEPHPRGSGMVLRVSMAMRMNSHPDHWKAGDTYLTPVGEFKGRFPQYADVRL